MDLLIEPNGGVKFLYDEAIDLRAMGELCITQASHVEPDNTGGWWADMAPVGGPKLGPFAKRSQSSAAELAWLDSF